MIKFVSLNGVLALTVQTVDHKSNCNIKCSANYAQWYVLSLSVVLSLEVATVQSQNTDCGENCFCFKIAKSDSFRENSTF